MFRPTKDGFAVRALDPALKDGACRASGKNRATLVDAARLGKPVKHGRRCFQARNRKLLLRAVALICNCHTNGSRMLGLLRSGIRVQSCRARTGAALPPTSRRPSHSASRPADSRSRAIRAHHHDFPCLLAFDTDCLAACERHAYHLKIRSARTAVASIRRAFGSSVLSTQTRAASAVRPKRT